MNGIPPSFLSILFSFLFSFFFSLEPTSSKGAYLVGLFAWKCNERSDIYRLWLNAWKYFGGRYKRFKRYK